MRANSFDREASPDAIRKSGKAGANAAPLAALGTAFTSAGRMCCFDRIPLGRTTGSGGATGAANGYIPGFIAQREILTGAAEYTGREVMTMAHARTAATN